MESLQRLADLDAVARLRAHDATLFSADPADGRAVVERLGWTDLAERAPAILPNLRRIALEAAEEGITDVALLGMGGSSLAALVIAQVLGAHSGIDLHVLDTTAPRTIDRALADLRPERTLFVFASKSGGTIEPNSLYAIFRDAADSAIGREAAGKRFVAITDPGTSLENLASAEGFRALIASPPAVGGRFSALSVFGLVPAALIGVDVDAMVERGQRMEAACALPVAENPAASLAAFVADCARAGRDKLTIVSSPALSSFGLWAEQLVAESLGKGGIGVVPVVELSDDLPQGYGPDRAVVVVRLASDERLAEWVPRLEAVAPTVELVLRDGFDLAEQFVLWEHAIALVGVLLGVDPFGQPDVQAAKEATAAALAGELDVPPASSTTPDGVGLTYAGALASPGHDEPSLGTAVGHALASVRAGDYLAILAFLPDDEALIAPLSDIVPPVSAALGAAITLELGPRYLHSTGQLHKGGPNSGVFVIVTTRDAADAPVPGRSWGLRSLHLAQAEGDLVTLAAAGRRVLRVDLPDASSTQAEALAHALAQAAGVAYQA